MRHAYCLLVCLSVGLLLLGSLPTHAGPYVPQGPFVVPTPGPKVPGPLNVNGKEYSEDWAPVVHMDKDAVPNADPEQVIAWDGAAGVADSFDYSLSRVKLQDDEDRQVDALANRWDILFGAVINNKAALLFSVDDEHRLAGAMPPFSAEHIFYEDIAGPPAVLPPAPGGPIWATPAQIDQHGVTDVDALEVWGPGPDDSGGGGPVGDANRYSLYGDPAVAIGVPRVSVWAYDPATHTSTPYITAAQLAMAIGEENLAEVIDLDAMMIHDEDDNDVFGDNPNDTIMFSIAPIAGVAPLFDGGEIWVWRSGDPLAGFLNHGGHLWNTAFNVMGSFGVDSENINALEAVSVPEPGTLILLSLGGLALGGWALVRRRQKA
jgi:hypothetical protein